IPQQRHQVPYLLERAKCPASDGFAKLDRAIARAEGELLPVGRKAAQRGDVCDREPLCPRGQVPNFQTIVQAARGKCVAIRREPEGVESVRIPSQRIKVVATATLPEQAPLKTSQVNLVCLPPMVFEQFPSTAQIPIFQSCLSSVHIGGVKMLLG